MDPAVLELIRRKVAALGDYGDVIDQPDDSEAGNELPELDLTEAPAQPSKLRESDDDVPVPEPDPKAWRQYGEPSAPPMVSAPRSSGGGGDLELDAEVRKYLLRQAREANDPVAQNERDQENMFRRLGRRPEKPTGINPEVMQYLQMRQRGDTAETASEARSRDAERRAALAEERLNAERDWRGRQLEQGDRRVTVEEAKLPSLIEGRKAGVELKAAQTAKAKAAAESIRNKAKAAAKAAEGSPGTTTDVTFDGVTYSYSRGDPDKTVARKDRQEVREKAGAWNQVLSLTDRLERDLEAWARAPSLDAKAEILRDATFATQSLTYALGGGAQQDAERKAATDALGAKVTDFTQVTNAFDAMLARIQGGETDLAKAAGDMTLRVRGVRGMAHDMFSGFSSGHGFDPKEKASPAKAPQPGAAAPPPQAQAGAKVPMVSAATGRTVMLTPESAAKLKAAGKVRDP